MRKNLKIALTIIGMLIGAGFASGQEINTFFFAHGINGIIGVFIANIIIGITINKALNIIEKSETYKYKDFLKITFENKSIEIIFDRVINFIMVIIFFIMVSGFGAYFEQELNVPKILGSIILVTLFYIIVKKKTDGIIKANKILVPIMIMLILIIGLFNVKEIKTFEIKECNSNFIKMVKDAILYASYNIVLLLPTLIPLKKYLNGTKNDAVISGMVVLFFLILSVNIFLLLTNVDIDINKIEMPAVYAASLISETFRIMYGLVILSSIFTTTISIGGSILNNIEKSEESYMQKVILLCITSIIFSNIEFSKMISTIYPLIGYIGIFQIISIIKNRDITS